LTVGASKLTGGVVSRNFEFALPFEPYPYDPAKARQLEEVRLKAE
jgi:hypothetical protein